jgi:hypothetical protein
VHERMPCADQPGARPCRSSVGVSPAHYRVSSDHSWRGKNLFLVTRNVKIPAKKRNKTFRLWDGVQAGVAAGRASRFCVIIGLGGAKPRISIG